MEITISDRKVQIVGDPEVLFEQDSLVSTLAATTDKDADWEYNVDIYMPTTNRYNSIIMTRNSNMLSVDLTRQMLPVDGRYIFQFRGQKNNGEVVYHTDKFELWVKDSIDLNKAYDPMPTEFYQLESEMKQMVEEVKQTAAETLPEINESTNGQFLSNDGTDAQWANVPDSGISQDEADARYLQLSGGTMSGNIDMSGSQIRGVRSIAAEGTTGNAGIQFASNGNFTNIVCGVSTSASFSANAVDFYNHNLDRVNSVNMTGEATIEDADYIGGNVEEASRTAIDFTTENAVGIWAQGEERVVVDANGVSVNGNDITGVNNVVAEGSTVDGLRLENNGATARILCGGTTSISFSENAIDAYEHRVVRVGEPINNTDAARKQDVDAVQTAVDTVSETVDGIIDGTEAIPYLPDDYTPPIATSTTVGVVKPGTNLEVTADGTLNYTGSTTSGITQTEADARYLQLTGGTLTGPLTMGNNKITMGGTPTETTDVTNKGYVDGVVKVVSDEVDGILAGTTPVAIPAATETHVGGIKPGAGTTVSSDGTLTIIVPVPTVEDNGKILVAENGVWVAKSLSEIQGSDNI